MGFNQLNPDLNDSFETYFPQMSRLVRLPYGAATVALGWGMKARTRLFGGQTLTNERIVEYPQLLRWLYPQGAVLDIGCVSSRLPIQLASLGYTVHGLDTRPYGFTHPNFSFYQADLFQWEPPRRYDSIVLVSVIEHFGFGGYGDLVLPEADREGVARIARWLAPGGQVLVSVPYGRGGVLNSYRVYDAARLAAVFGGLEWVESRYFQRVQGAWVPSSAEALADVASAEFPVNGVAVLHLRAAGGDSQGKQE